MLRLLDLGCVATACYMAGWYKQWEWLGLYWASSWTSLMLQSEQDEHARSIWLNDIRQAERELAFLELATMRSELAKQSGWTKANLPRART